MAVTIDNDSENDATTAMIVLCGSYLLLQEEEEEEAGALTLNIEGMRGDCSGGGGGGSGGGGGAMPFIPPTSCSLHRLHRLLHSSLDLHVLTPHLRRH